MRPSRLALLTATSVCFLIGCLQEFDLSVGAFEIRQDGAILWTHVVPEDPEKTVVLDLVVATDPWLLNIVRLQKTTAGPDSDFTAREQVSGLSPGTRYYYRFTGLDASLAKVQSPTGSFQTAPDDYDASPVRFAISGDSNIGYTSANGFDFHVLSAAAGDDPDFFVFFGDTIYADSGVLPGGADAFTLDEYRAVHRLTRADPHLQTLLAATGTFSGWDDHEVRNDYDGETVDPVQRDNGYQAFFEYLPLREDVGGPPFETHRSVRWGRHAELFFLDGRQFRSAERFCNAASPDGPPAADTLFSPFVDDEVFLFGLPFGLPAPLDLVALGLVLPSDPACAAGLLADPTRTMLGAAQLADLQQALLDSDATFKIIVNNTPIANLYVQPYDRWEGYGAEQADLLGFIAANLDPDRTIVLTTDFHTNLAVRRDELTELIVGPIGQSTLATSTFNILEGQQPGLGALLPQVLAILDGLVDDANGGTPVQLPPPLNFAFAPDRVIGSVADAFSYALVDVFEEAGSRSSASPSGEIRSTRTATTTRVMWSTCSRSRCPDPQRARIA